MTEMDTVVIVAVATPTGRSSLQFNLNLANKMLKVDPSRLLSPPSRAPGRASEEDQLFAVM